MKFLLRLSTRPPISERCIDKQFSFARSIIVVSIAIIFLCSGCRSYFKVMASDRPTSQVITDLSQSGKKFIVHFNDNKWLLTDVHVKENVIIGIRSDYKMLPTLKPVRLDKKNRYRARKQKYLLSEVHLSLNESPGNDNTLVSFPLSAVDRIDIYDKDKTATTLSWVYPGIGITLIVVALFEYVSIVASGFQ